MYLICIQNIPYQKEKIEWCPQRTDTEEGGVQIDGRNIRSLRYANDSTLLTEEQWFEMASDESEGRKHESRTALKHQENKNHDFRRNTQL